MKPGKNEEKLVRTPRIVLAGANSGSGKTTVAAGLMGALSRMGLRVQGFKVGPDFIDPSYHTAVTGRKSRNLDEWLLSRRTILELFHQNTMDSEIAVIEGVMGLYDGLGGNRRIGSTAHMAKLLRAPVILVVDAWGMAESVAAIVTGCQVLDREVRIAGAILNRVAGEKHTELCKRAIESKTGIPVVGALTRNQGLSLPERHLGLTPASEMSGLSEKLEAISEFVEANLDLERIKKIASSASPLDAPIRRRSQKPITRIGIACDESFNFYYQDGLEMLSSLGAELRYFSPVHDKKLPDDISGLYIGGGFPEVFSKELEANGAMRDSIRKSAEDGMPVLAECGGLMYLGRSITNFEGIPHAMVGLLDCRTEMTPKITLNYTDAAVTRSNILSQVGGRIRGHEFHFSKIVELPTDARFAYQLKRGRGITDAKDGWVEYSVLAQYMHTHLSASSKYPANFIRACARYGGR